jgi:hypothetical protein
MQVMQNSVSGNGHARQGVGDQILASEVLVERKPEVEVPSLPARVNAKNVVSCAIENLRKIRDRALEIERWVTGEAYPFFFAVDREIAENGQGILDQTAGFELEEKPATIGQMYVEYRTRIKEYLNSPHPLIRCAVHSSRLIAYLSQIVPFAKFVAQVDDFVEKGYFVADANGPIKVWERSFSLAKTNEFGQMGEREERVIADAVAEQIARLDAEFHEVNVEKAKTMAKKATITPDMLLRSGEKGICFLYAPAQVVHATTGACNTYKVSEMWLLVELTNRGMIFVLESIGPKQKCLELDRLSNEGIGVKASTLDFRNPPDYSAFKKAGFTEDQAKDIRRLWNLAKRGINYWREHDEPALKAAALEKLAGKKAELKKKATIPANRFFLDNELPLGIAFAEFNADWLEGKSRNVVFENGFLYFLVERFKKDDEVMIRLNEVPEHLASFFSGCQGEYACGEKFAGIPTPLQEVLRAIWRQLSKEPAANV